MGTARWTGVYNNNNITLYTLDTVFFGAVCILQYGDDRRPTIEIIVITIYRLVGVRAVSCCCCCCRRAGIIIVLYIRLLYVYINIRVTGLFRVINSTTSRYLIVECIIYCVRGRERAGDRARASPFSACSLAVS